MWSLQFAMLLLSGAGAGAVAGTDREGTRPLHPGKVNFKNAQKGM